MKRLAALVGAWLMIACGSDVLKTAQHGDLTALRGQVEQQQSAGKLSAQRVERLAWMVAGRELRSSTGTLAVLRLEQMRPCAGRLERVLRDRASRLDDAGAKATRLLLDLGRLRPEPLVARYREAESGAWRAVAARAAVQPQYALERRAFFEDPDERVRRGALEAAIASPLADDLEALLEVARLDPNLDHRSLALRALGGIGGERTVWSLADRWTRAAEPERLAILQAWASPATYATGGRDRLVWAVETTKGRLALEAAAALAQQGDAPTAELGRAWLLRGIATGTTVERRLAIHAAPLDPEPPLDALRAAARDDDRQIQVLALARLLEIDPRASAVRDPLRALASGEDSVALQARAALAAAGDTTVRTQLHLELDAPRSYRRLAAARGLLALGDYAALATALADDDPRVRAQIACSVLAQ